MTDYYQFPIAVKKMTYREILQGAYSAGCSVQAIYRGHECLTVNLTRNRPGEKPEPWGRFDTWGRLALYLTCHGYMPRP